MDTSPEPRPPRPPRRPTSLPVDRHALRSAFTGFVGDNFPTHAVSAAWNEPGTSPVRIRSDLRALHARVDRGLYGSHYNKRPAHQRTRFLGVVEGVGYHPHVHSAWHVPYERHRAFEDLFGNGATWKKLAPAGSLDLQRINGPHDWAAYMVKVLSLDLGDDVILSDEYLPAS